MQLKDIPSWTLNVPHTSVRKSVLLYQFVRRIQPHRILELGTGNGKGTFIMAAALEENGAGRVESYDLDLVERRVPNVFEMLAIRDLGRYVDMKLSPYSYTWQLMEQIRQAGAGPGKTVGVYDFCFIDGAHTWNVDALAFLLSDMLLKPGAWVLLDDLGWRPPAPATSLSGPTDVAQVDLIAELLIRPNPEYVVVREDDTWLWARKKPAEADSESLRKESQAELGLAYSDRANLPEAVDALQRAHVMQSTLGSRLRRRVKLWLRKHYLSNLASKIRYPNGE